MLRPGRVIAIALLVAYAVGSVIGLTFYVLNGVDSRGLVQSLQDASPPLVFGLYAIAGTIIATRARGNLVGWLLVIMGLSATWGFAADQYSVFAYVRSDGALPLAPFAAWLSMWIWLVMMAGLALVLFVFPNGRLPSARWRLPLLAVIATLSLALIGFAFGTQANAEHPEVRNPLLVDALIPLRQFLEDSFVIYLASYGLGVASLVARYRSAAQTERQQLKWIAATAVFIFAGLAVSNFIPDFPLLSGLAWIVSISLLPIAVTLSILRYGLYEIDVVINRAIVYAVLTALLGATYVGAVIATQALLGPFTGGSEVAVAASTLVVVALFQPLRRRVQHAVDHRFYRARYDAERILDRFSALLRDEVDLGALEHELIAVVDRTIRPAHSSVWLRPRR